MSSVELLSFLSLLAGCALSLVYSSSLRAFLLFRDSEIFSLKALLLVPEALRY